jgi:hypothetical protein
MSIEKREVLEVLSDLRLRNIRFVVGPIHINSSEYDKVSDYISSGAIKVESGKESYSLYFPQINTIRTRRGDPPLDLNTRTNLLHECTHAIADINKVKVTRMVDEAAAYLAQFAYLLLLDPSTSEPPIGTPINNMMRLGMQLVKKYHLGKPAGLGAVIASSDISGFAQAVHANPEYGKDEKGNKISINEMLIADGVALNSKQAEEFFRLQLSRLSTQLLDDLMAKDIDQMLTMKSSTVAHENYVTWDPELLTLFNSFKCGTSAQKKAALQKLIRIFMTIDQRSAMSLLQRLSTTKKGDAVSERFQSGFPPPEKSTLLSALKIPR